MQRLSSYLVALLLLVLWGCKEPEPALPDYLSMPSDLDGYTGSGLVDIQGGLTLRAAGVERLDANTKTYSGVQGSISGDYLQAHLTLGQPRPYKESTTVPIDYRANGELLIMNTLEVGTYPMGIRATPTPRGAITDIILNLPGPQIYTAQNGTLTIASVDIVRASGSLLLKRVQGSFSVSVTGSGVGTQPGKEIPLTGTFDLLFVQR